MRRMPSPNVSTWTSPFEPAANEAIEPVRAISTGAPPPTETAQMRPLQKSPYR